MKRTCEIEFLSFALLFMSGTLLIVANIFQNPYLGIACSVILCISIALYCVNEFSKRIGLALFMACMFTFQLAGVALPVFLGNTSWMMGVNNYEYVMICNCLFISCMILIMTTSFLERNKFVWDKRSLGRLKVLKDASYNISVIQRLAFVICLISSTVAIAGEAHRMAYAVAHGYMSMYGEYSMPVIVRRMQIISRTSMFIGLAAMPSKKRIWTYFLLGLPVPVMNLVEGSRSAIMISILFYIYYFYTYGEWKNAKVSKADRKKKRRKFILVLIVIVCIGTPLLYVYGYSRVGRSVETGGNPLKLIIQFFASQGGSAKLIGRAVQYKGQLPGICYSLGSLIDRIQGNHFAAFSVESALNGNSFGNIMTYMESEYNYTVLHVGVGSSYIAEVYYDFGFGGLIMVNIIIGYVLKLLSSYGRVGIISRSFVFMLFYYMMTIPRAPLFTPIDNVLSKSCLTAVFFIFFLGRRKGGAYEKSKTGTVDTRLYYRGC